MSVVGTKGKSQVYTYSDNLIPELHIAVVGTVRPLRGSHRNGQETLYLFQKYVLYWELYYIVSRNNITSVKATFCVVL